jgi:glycogen debranching enzyme
MLNSESSRKVVEVVEKELATPYGLRTLSFDDPKFVGKCYGDQRSRDTAYHNGTIWPWLLGPYVSAYLKVHNSPEARRDGSARDTGPGHPHGTLEDRPLARPDQR